MCSSIPPCLSAGAHPPVNRRPISKPNSSSARYSNGEGDPKETASLPYPVTAWERFVPGTKSHFAAKPRVARTSRSARLVPWANAHEASHLVSTQLENPPDSSGPKFARYRAGAIPNRQSCRLGAPSASFLVQRASIRAVWFRCSSRIDRSALARNCRPCMLAEPSI